jgi:separase
MELGYTGKAAVEFDRATRIMKTGRCDTNAKLNHMLVYAQYLALTGDIERSTEVYHQAKEQGDKTVAIVRNNSKYKSAQHKLSRAVLLANASFTRSYISMELASVDDAVKDATNSLRKLSQLSSSLFRKSASRYEKPDQLVNPFTSDTKQYENNVTEEQQQHGIVQTVADIALQDSHWGIAQKMSNCFARLGVLHSARGSWREAEYFLKQGLKLSEQLGTPVAASTYLVWLADLYWKIDKYEDSQNNLERALELQSMVSSSRLGLKDLFYNRC